MLRPLLLVGLLVFLSACATPFPAPQNASYKGIAEPDGNTLFEHTFEAHGGANIAQLRDVSVGLTGKWKQLIRRIQPLVTDFKYRVDSQERLLPKERIYASQYVGPAGNKSVFRKPSTIEVLYNGRRSTDPEVLSSTALTADSFHLFLLGPLALAQWRGQFSRLSDAEIGGKIHYRVHLTRVAGFGYAKQDEVVLWIDPETRFTKLVQITLEGHATTQGAHVEVEYLDYIEIDSYVFPSQFFERVNAPISIDAHAWHLTGIDINRGYQAADLTGESFRAKAQQEAKAINQDSAP